MSCQQEAHLSEQLSWLPSYPRSLWHSLPRTVPTPSLPQGSNPMPSCLARPPRASQRVTTTLYYLPLTLCLFYVVRIVFLDGDGTLWYPRVSRNTKPPHWVYDQPRALERMTLVPKARQALRRLRLMRVLLVLVSTHPFSARHSRRVLMKKVRHFGLMNIFEHIVATPTTESAKASAILRILARHRIPRGQALMVGDSYRWDYEPARTHQIPALLIESRYAPSFSVVGRSARIASVASLPDYILEKGRLPQTTASPLPQAPAP